MITLKLPWKSLELSVQSIRCENFMDLSQALIEATHLHKSAISRKVYFKNFEKIPKLGGGREKISNSNLQPYKIESYFLRGKLLKATSPAGHTPIKSSFFLFFFSFEISLNAP